MRTEYKTDLKQKNIHWARTTSDVVLTKTESNKNDMLTISLKYCY